MARTIILAVLLALTAPGLAAADQLLGEYRALLSGQDHFNSKGQRLTRFWQVIRQDRANFHRFGKQDSMDEWDAFFGTADARAQAERWIMNGSVEPGLERRIVNGEVAIRVEIWGRGSKPRYLKVFVY